MALNDYRTLVRGKIRDATENANAPLVAPSYLEDGIREALRAYERVRPRQRITTLTGNGSAVTFAVPSDWEQGFSTIVSIEYPVDLQDPDYLDEDEFTVRLDSTGAPTIRLLDLTLGNLVKAYVLYTVSHTVNDDGADTVLERDRYAIANLAAATVLRQLAAHYAHNMAPSLNVDVANRSEQVAKYLALAKELQGLYEQHMGLGKDASVGAAFSMADLDETLEGGFPRMFHENTER